MKTYIMTIAKIKEYVGCEEIKRVRINEEQKKLIVFLCDNFDLEEALDEYDITMDIVAEEDNIINLI